MSGVRADLAKARSFAEEWIDAWNARDLDRIMTHYSSEVIFTSPMVVQLGASTTGTLHGAHDLSDYFAQGLRRFSDLRFELVEVMVGVESLTVVYRNQVGRVAAEVMTIRQGVVTHSSAHYGQPLAS